VVDVGSVLGNRVVAIATDPRSPKTLYASNLSNLYRSTDGGATWKRRNRPEGSGLLLALTILPTQPEILYAGGSTGLFRSQNGGATWTKLTQGLPDGGGVNSLILSGNTLLAAVSTFVRRGGVFRSSDAGTSWSLYSQGLTATTVTAIGFGPPGTLWVVANGVLFRSTDQGVTWTRIRPGPPTSSYVNRVVVDPIDRSNVFISFIDGQVRRSDDGGATWEIAGSPSNQTTFYPFDLVIDPKTPSTLYAAGYRIAKSTDRGSTWKELETGGHSGFFDLAISPSSPSTLYALGDKSLILRSTDGGATWSARLRIARNLLPNAIVVDPLLPKTVYIISEQGIYKTKDGGETWTLFSDSFRGRPAFPLEMSPSGLLYAGVWYDKLYSIRDGDDAWSVLEGSGPWEFRTLAFDPHDPCRIYVGAVGQSLLGFTRSGTPECPGEP
jgi:photosystem II stability/assembly factor-like uncharacterized protein